MTAEATAPEPPRSRSPASEIPMGNITERPMATKSSPTTVGTGSDMASVRGMATATRSPAAASVARRPKRSMTLPLPRRPTPIAAWKATTPRTPTATGMASASRR